MNASPPSPLGLAKVFTELRGIKIFCFPSHHFYIEVVLDNVYPHPFLGSFPHFPPAMQLAITRAIPFFRVGVIMEEERISPLMPLRF